MKQIISGAFIGLALFTTSCEKCTTCIYDDREGHEIIETFCGNGEDTRAFRQQVEESAIEERSKFSCHQDQ